jgi:hypothetical protein
LVHRLQLSVYGLIIFFFSFFLNKCFQSVCGFLNSCLLEGLKFCSPFLVRDLRRSCSKRVSIVFCDVMIFLISINWCVLLRLFWGCIVSCLSAETRGGRQCWGVENLMGSPNTRLENKYTKTRTREGNKESAKVYLSLKRCEPLYTCPWTPFYREAKGLLHFDITIESREYSCCEHVLKRLLHPVICGANFTYLQDYHQFTPRTRTFEATPLTWSSFDLQTSIHKSRQSSRSLSRASEYIVEEMFLKISEVLNFTVSQIRQIPAVLKREADLRFDVNSTIVSHNVRGSANHVKIAKHFHESFSRLETEPRVFDLFTNTFTNSSVPTFWGWNFLAEFPNTSHSGKRVDFNDPFPRTIYRISVKTSPSVRQSRHTSLLQTCNGHFEAVSWNYPLT